MAASKSVQKAKPAKGKAAPAKAKPTNGKAANGKPKRGRAADVVEADPTLFDPLTPGETADALRTLIEDRRLWGQGLGWVDAHLLASALLSSCRFWTLDKRLDRAARLVGCRS